MGLSTAVPYPSVNSTSRARGQQLSCAVLVSFFFAKKKKNKKEISPTDRRVEAML